MALVVDGTAVAVSSNFTLLGIGTDNSGSIRIPAGFNGVTGLRPSTGLISQRGIFPMGNLDGVAGPITRTIKDLAVVLDVIAKPDPLDEKTLKVPRIKSYTAYLNENGLKNKRIGIVHRINNIDTFYQMPEEVLNIIQNSLQRIKLIGTTLVDNIILPNFDSSHQNNESGQIEDIDNYLGSFPSSRENFRDICKSNRTSTFGNVEACLSLIKSTPKKNSTQYSQVLEKFKKNKIYIENKMQEYQVDVLLIPLSTNGSATYDTRT